MEKIQVLDNKKDHLIYSSPAIDAAAISNDGAVSGLYGKDVGAVRVGIPASDKSNRLLLILYHIFRIKRSINIA